MASKALTNRENAKKSTGPKTALGKRRSSSNALAHGLLSQAPVLSTEDAGRFQGHLEAIRDSLAPVGYLESLLVERVAVLTWRLQRVTRFETGNLENEIANCSAWDGGTEESELLVSLSPEQKAEDVEMASSVAADFDAVAESEDPLPAGSVMSVLSHMALEAGIELDGLAFDFLEGTELDAFGAWTRVLFDRALLVMKEASGEESSSFQESRARIHLQAVRARFELEKATKVREASLRATGLLEEGVVERIARYESHLDRSIYRALHELERLQGARAGTPRPSMALDLDVSVGPRKNRFEQGP